MSLTPKTLHSPTSHLIAHPTLPLLLSPLGATPTLTSSKTGDQKFLPPHTDQITALALSKKGKYVASGQKTFMGWKAGIQVVKLDQQGEIAEEWARFDLHKVSNISLLRLGSRHHKKACDTKVTGQGGHNPGSWIPSPFYRPLASEHTMTHID